ncbi:MAG: aspartate kinase [Muribaculaceae bacterium]|nr:aspartate kinase [Muribaculaceae bacterium]
MKVMKFGGTSVGSAERFKNVARLLLDRGRNIVVLSAMSGTTNSLVEIADYLYKRNSAGAQEMITSLENKYSGVVNALFETHEAREKARKELKGCFSYLRSFVREQFGENEEKEILSQGELMSTILMANYLRELGVDVVLLPALDFMRTDENAEPDIPYIEKRLLPMLEEHAEAPMFITQGYICRNCRGDVDNLQRGGSDLTASLIGAVTGAEEIEIWTDIDGMHNSDPRYVANTQPVHELHFEEAAELAYFGAKILHPTCVLPAKVNNIPVRLLNTMQPEAAGTLISNFPPSRTIKAIAAKDNITAIKIKSSRMLLSYGFMSQVFEVFERYRIPIDMVATSEVGVSLTIDNRRDFDRIINELKVFATVSTDDDMVIICVVGDLEWHNTGFEAKVVEALRGIPVRMISYGGSNYNISLLVKKENKIEALNALHKKLFIDK